MSLADLVPVALVTRKERQPLTRAEIRRRWKVRNRAKFNAYRAEWRARRAA